MAGDAPPIHWFDRIASTQDTAHQLAADGTPDGTAVVAVEQTAGRGSRGRDWVAPRGGLWLSVVCRPAGGPAIEVLSLRAALAAADSLADAGVPGVRIKWPNDLMLEGRKLGGILCEARWTGDQLGWLVIGLGINVRNEVPPALSGVAIALAHAGSELRAGDLVAPMVGALRDAGSRAGPLERREREAFAARDWLAGRTLTAPAAGTADGVTESGVLRIRGAGQLLHLARTGPVVVAGPSTLHV
jgi:BirA family transcriptional regulator, biotin operon repressor / biotin---[acetyl-CoA-carboxylase] ligase